ncbi:protein of unknown function (plasmid) [Pararobbsia alpina]
MNDTNVASTICYQRFMPVLAASTLRTIDRANPWALSASALRATACHQRNWDVEKRALCDARPG